MTTWRYVACRWQDDDGGEHWDVRELYESEPPQEPGYTARGVRPYGESREELRNDIARMAVDIGAGMPVLDLTGDKPRLIPPV